MKKTIFLTGATGNMGSAGLTELLRNREKYNITILVRPSRKNKKFISKYQNIKELKVVWGDLLSYNDVLNSVTGADYVLHVGGMVSPQADYYPEKTMKVNVTAAENIVKAVLAQPNSDNIRVVYIGSVAQTGFYEPPYHFGRTGDLIRAAQFDNYAISKSIAERIIADSGIKHWVSLRQSGILYRKIIFNGYNPIVFHVPLKGVLEWTTVEDSGRLLANVCDESVPENFWNRFYNISSGKNYRMTNYEFECRLLKAIHCPPPEKIFNTNWFALKNFHGQWYADADILEDYLHFRNNIPLDDYFDILGKKVPKFFTLSKLFPHIVKIAMYVLATKKHYGTMYWIKHHDVKHVNAFFGSYDAWKNIPNWKEFNLSRPSETALLLPHGFDESKSENEMNITDMQQMAKFRKGKCLSESMQKGNMTTNLTWQCEHGHIFNASPRLIMYGGHWCEECLKSKKQRVS